MLEAALVSPLHAVPLLRLRALHHHRIDAENDDLWLLEFQAPQKKVLQARAEFPDPHPRKGGEETFHLVRRTHLVRVGLDRTGIAAVFLEPIELDHVRARAVEKEAQNSLEEARDRQALPALAHRAEEALEVRYKVEAAQIPREKRQAGAACQVVRRDLHAVDLKCVDLESSFCSPVEMRA
jgi:hypothetical protein